MKVNKGDKIDVSVWARYEEKLSYARDFNLTALSGLLGSTFVSQTGFEGYSTTQTSSTLLGALTAAAFGTDTDDTRPYAYLNYVILDNALGYRNGDAERVPETAGSEPAELYLAANKPVEFGFGEEIVIEEDGYIYIWVSNESQSTRVWFDDLTVTHEQSLVVQASDYGVWGDLLREQRSDDKKYRFGYQGQFAEKDEETGWNHFELREYENTLARWLVVDPKRIGHSPYVGMDNDPLNLIDPDGGNPNDWYRNNTTNEVVWIEDSDAVEGHTHLSANALDPSVINAVSESIRSGGIEAFLMYFNDERLGKDYFFNLSHTFDVPRDGWLATVIDNSPVVSDAFHISEWTHTTIANGTEANNALEHHIGTFLMTYRWGPDMATVITTANEVRGLIINDRQSGNVVRALEGAGGTAFEWSDLGNNAKGLYKYARWHLGEIFSKKAWSNFTNFRSWEEIKALPKAH